MRRALTLFVITLFCASAVAARGQGAGADAQAEAARLNAEVLRLYRERKYDEALPLARRVLEIRERAAGAGGEDMAVASALNNLAAVYARKGKNDEAEQHLRRSLAIAEKRVGAESDFAADVASQLGLIKLEGRDYKEAGAFLRRALAAKEKLHGVDGAALVPVLLNLTDLNFLRGEPGAAYSSLGHALSILKAQPPRRDPATAGRLKAYYCPLMALAGDGNSDLRNRLWEAIWRLDRSEEAAEVKKTVVEGEVINGKVISKPMPDYPRIAKDQRLSGVVVVKILVDESGKVVDAEALCGHTLLAQASVEAARKARFTPTLLAGRAVKVSGIITYNFIY